MWDEETEETEDDVMGLKISFLASQAIKMCITGMLPNAEGGEREGTTHDNTQTLFLLLIAFGLIALVVVVSIIPAKSEEEGGALWNERRKDQLKLIISMIFAWCLYFAIDWYMNKNPIKNATEMLVQVQVALAATAVAFSMIYGLDKIADMKSTGDDVDKAIRTVCMSLALLIGFGWEKTFDMAVEASVSGAQISWLPDYAGKMALALFLCAIVLPAWRKFILPTCLEFIKMDEEAEEAEKEEEEKKKRGERGLEEHLLKEVEKAEKKKNDNVIGLNVGALAERKRDLDKHLRKMTIEALDHKYAGEYKRERHEHLRGKNSQLGSTVNMLHGEINQIEAIANRLEGR